MSHRSVNPARRIGSGKRYLALAAALASLAGCAANPVAPEGSSGSSPDLGSTVGPPTTVEVWAWGPDPNNTTQLWARVEEALKSQGENIEIEYVTKVADSYDGILRTAMTGERGPELLYTRPTGTTSARAFAAAGLIEPVEGGDLDAYGAALEVGAYQGRNYGVPQAHNVVGIFYNKTIFAENGLQEPKTWRELIGICDTLREKGVVPIYAMGIQTWMLGLTIETIEASTVSNEWASGLIAKELDYTSDPWVVGLAKYQELAQKCFEPNFIGVGSAGNEQEQALGLGQSAMIFDGNWAVAQIMEFDPELSMGFFPVPVDDPETIAGRPGPAEHWADRTQVYGYGDGPISLNANIADPAKSEAAHKVMDIVKSRAFAEWAQEITEAIVTMEGIEPPESSGWPRIFYNALAAGASAPNFGPGGLIDDVPEGITPPPAAEGVAQLGVFSALIEVAGPLATGDMSPEEAAQQMQRAVAWYFVD